MAYLARMTIAELNAAKMAAKAERYPSFPLAYLKPAKSSQSDTNSLTAAIVDYVNLHRGCLAYRVNNMGVYREGEKYIDVMGNERRAEGKWTKGGGRKGTPDVHCCIRGKYVVIEVKYGKDSQSDEQKDFERDVTEAGGVYLIAKNLDQIVSEIRKFL